MSVRLNFIFHAYIFMSGEILFLAIKVHNIFIYNNIHNMTATVYRYWCSLIEIHINDAFSPKDNRTTRITSHSVHLNTPYECTLCYAHDYGHNTLTMNA